MIDPPWITETEAADGAFALLTSSTPGRYIRMAKDAAVHSRLRARIEENSQVIPLLVSDARMLWRQMLGSKQRAVQEPELAIILVLLSHTAVPEVDDLLSAIGLIDRPAVAWIAALARRLLQERASNAHPSEFMWGGASPSVDFGRVSSQNAAPADHTRLWRPAFDTISPKEGASQPQEPQALVAA